MVFRYLPNMVMPLPGIDYRNQPRGDIPGSTKIAMRSEFVLAHATNYGIDPKRFVIGGASAGGHLALLLAPARQNLAFGADPAIKTIESPHFLHSMGFE